MTTGLRERNPEFKPDLERDGLPWFTSKPSYKIDLSQYVKLNH